MLMRKVDRKLVLNVKVIPGEPCVTQHLLLGEVIGFVEAAPMRKQAMISKCRV